MNLLRAAMGRVQPGLLGMQLLGNGLLLGLGSLWLLIPDSHVWQLIVSVLLIALLAISFLELHAYTLRRLRRPTQPARVWLGAVILAVWLLLFFGVSQGIDRWAVHIQDRAGFWNSRLSPTLRAVWTFERLQQWQTEGAMLLLWVVLPAAVLPWLIETVSAGTQAGSWRRGLHVLARWQHWVAAVVLLGAVRMLTPRLVDWHPYDSVHGEIWSALFRLPLVFVADAVLLLLLCGFDGVLLARYHFGGDAGVQPTLESLHPVNREQGAS